MLPIKALTERLAELFRDGSYQSHCADNKTMSSASFQPMRPTLNDTYGDRVKQHTKNKEQSNCEERKKHSPYSVERRQQATRHTSTKDSRKRTNAAMNCTNAIFSLENWMLPPAKLLLE